ncbi:hypothetical protein [uncultured Desulfosarcina sp.]|uniref:hypothetical protein n=1 Tax=uncultured Desulfosarcina sp. TaxID=218289 RepID=UPI0029C65840|nr:hypothetical protein [uncultured Desulfosarcina sp.]
MNKTQGIEIAEQLRNRGFTLSGWARAKYGHLEQVARMDDKQQRMQVFDQVLKEIDELLDEFGRMDEIGVVVKRRD